MTSPRGRAVGGGRSGRGHAGFVAVLGHWTTFGYGVNHGDSCAQGCITPDDRERGTPPLLRRIRPSSWRHRGFKRAQRFWTRPDHAATDAVFAQQHVAKHDREERGL
jgi:hypothetical protein